MMDHDQRFKAMIREFFGDFMRLFFGPWTKDLDFSSVEWLDQEIFPDPPEGERHVVDLVAKLQGEPTSSEIEPCLALVHVEIESADSTTRIKSRLPSYYIHLRNKFTLPVLPIVIYLKVGLDGIGQDVYIERFGELEVLTFRYLYVGLPALDALEYVGSGNYLGVALSALMRIPPDRIIWLGEEAFKLLAESTLNEQQRFLLSECVEAYLPLDEQQLGDLTKRVLKSPSTEVSKMNKTTYDRGIEAGIEKGMEAGIEKGMEHARHRLQNVLLRVGSNRLGGCAPDLESRVRAIDDIDQLAELTSKVMIAATWDDLFK